jgi:hypothetical protein
MGDGAARPPVPSPQPAVAAGLFVARPRDRALPFPVRQDMGLRTGWEAGIPYELRYYRRDAVTRLSPPELKALYPLGAALAARACRRITPCKLRCKCSSIG